MAGSEDPSAESTGKGEGSGKGRVWVRPKAWEGWSVEGGCAWWSRGRARRQTFTLVR